MDEIGPAATLSILVKAQGVQATAGQLKGLDAAGRNAGKGIATAETHAKRSSKMFAAMGSAAKSAGLLVGAAGLAAGIKTAVGEFREAQKVGAQTTAVLKSTGGAAKVTKKHIEDLAGSISKKSGIDDEAIQSGENLLLTFTKVRNETGKGNKIFDRATQTITDMSVALGQPAKSSAIQLGKALNDPIKGITALRRVGVSFTADQEKQIKAMVQSGDLLGAQKRILKELKMEFGGSAAAQATAGDKLKVSLGNLAEVAGSFLVPQLDKAAKFLTDFINQMIAGQGIAKVIIPVFFNVRDAIASVIPVIGQIVGWFKQHQAVAVALVAAIGLLVAPLATLAVGFAAAYAKSQTFRDAIDAVVTVVLAMPAAVSGAFNAVKTTVTNVMNAIVAEIRKWDVLKAVVGAAVLGIVAVVKAALQLIAPVFTATFGVIKAIVTGAFNAMKAIVQGGLQVIRGVIQVFGGLFKGDFGQVWEGVKNIFKGVGTALAGIIRAALGTVRAAGVALGKGLVDGVKSALNLAHTLAVAMRDLISKAPGYALGVGKAIVSGIISGIKAAAGGIGNALKGAVKGATPDFLGIGDGIGKSIGAGSIVPVKGGGSLMGARPIMSRFAAVGAANGLSVSSGLRRGSITSSGNQSYHSTGEAVDLAGSPAGMMKTFKTLRSRFGSKLAELIYTPGGAGIKNGKPNVYTGQVAADHFDHVHVAFDSGKPGLGDGIGKARAAFTGDGSGKLDKEKAWLEDAWNKVAPLFGRSGGKDPLHGLFKHIRFSNANAFVGVATDPGKGNESAELLWPRWLWQNSKGQKALDNKSKLQLFIHEMAHRFQDPKQTSAEWLAEGGAEAFARISMSRRFGGAVRSGSDPYNAFVTKVMKDKGVGWVTSGQFGTIGVGQPGHGPTRGGGIGVAIAAARKAGFTGEALVRMVAIAGRESNYNPRAANYKPPDHSIGLWQINQLAHHGRFGSDAELMNPDTNAHAAWVLSSGGKNFGPWSTNRGLSAARIEAARKAIAGGAGGGATAGAGGSAGGGAGGGAAGGGAAAGKVNPYDQSIASADVAIADAGHAIGKFSTGLRTAAALRVKQKILGSRIRTVRAALKKKGLTAATRLRLTQELAQLIPEHAQLGKDRQAALAGPAPEASIGGLGGEGGDGGDPNQPLIDALEAAAEIERQRIASIDAQTEAIRTNSAEMKRQTDFATLATSTSNYQAWKALADIMSGQIVGRGVGPRSFTPGNGVEAVY